MNLEHVCKIMRYDELVGHLMRQRGQLKECCQEVLDWKDSGTLPPTSTLRYVADVYVDSNLGLAQSAVHDAAMRLVVNSAP